MSTPSKFRVVRNTMMLKASVIGGKSSGSRRAKISSAIISSAELPKMATMM